MSKKHKALCYLKRFSDNKIEYLELEYTDWKELQSKVKGQWYAYHHIGEVGLGAIILDSYRS